MVSFEPAIRRYMSSDRALVTPSADGTHVDWLTSYTHPAHAGGKLMEAVSRRLLRWSFQAVLAGCAKALES
jgi:hypothetical protein